jgi:HEAT repeat protein
VRWEVIKILGELGDARAAGPIAERLKEDDIVADPALRRLGPAAEPALIELLKSPEAILRMKACRILRVVGGKDTLEFMKSAKADPDLGVRNEAALTMKTIFARIGSSAKKK